MLYFSPLFSMPHLTQHTKRLAAIAPRCYKMHDVIVPLRFLLFYKKNYNKTLNLQGVSFINLLLEKVPSLHHAFQYLHQTLSGIIRQSD